MVLGRNDKRKRREGDLVDLMDPLSEAPKRAKVHAQRKFAQGAATTVFNSVQTVMKEKEGKPKPSKVTELITDKRPNTEDFLTFLCFRGTSILPPSLNFFNIGTKKEKSESKLSAVRKNNSIKSRSTTPVKPPEINPSPVVTKAKTLVNPVKKKIAATNVGKNVTNKYKTATSTVQALKKKYQEQRLAKQKIENKLKVSSVMRTRSSTTSTTTTSRSVIKSRNNKLTSSNKLINKKHCLRSNSVIEKRKLLSPKNKISPKQKKKIIIENEKSCESDSSLSSSSSASSKSSLDVKQQPVKIIKKNIVTRNNTKTEEIKRVTRSRGEVTATTPLVKTSQRPSRKTKEAAAVYMEILSRKLTSPDIDDADDNNSLDSFPELPTTRRSTTTAEIDKDKLKLKGKLNKEKERKTDNNKKVEKPEGRKVNKKPGKVDKYSESEAEDDDKESSSSEEIADTSRPVTRRTSTPSVNCAKPSDRSLRSSARNSPKQQEAPVKPQRDKKINEIKRKKEEKPVKSPGCSKNTVKEKDKKQKTEEQNSDDEPLIKLAGKKRKELAKTESSKASVEKIVVPFVEESQEDKYETIKISDDEESFHGFTQKAITKVLNALSNNLLEESELLKEEEESLSKLVGVSKDVEKKSTKPDDLIKLETKDMILPLTSSSPMPSVSESDKKCLHSSGNTSGIIDIPLSASLGRKERVNMSTEQIEKWLNESSMAKEESKAEMETVTNFSYDVLPDKPTNKQSDTSHLSIPARIQHLVRPVNVAIAKMAEKSLNKNSNIQLKSSSTLSGTGIALAKPISIPTNRNKINADIKEIIKFRNAKNTSTFIKDINDDSDLSSKTDGNQSSIDGLSPDKRFNSPDKKLIQHKKTFLPKVKERKSTVPSVNAFSPENERSVYAFESEIETPISTPFRRKLRESKSGASSDITESDDGTVKTPTKSSNKSLIKSKSIGINCTEDDASIKSPSDVQLTSKKLHEGFGNAHVFPVDKLTNVWNSLNCSTSIAVQVNFDEQAQGGQINNQSDDANGQKSTEISTQTECTNDNEDDNDSHVFYIPLQTVSRNGPNTVPGQQLIQGVAVKLGTEGPNGPNQRVLLRAHLVTKPPVAIARCPPIGTVQPTTRTPSTSTPASISESIPSTSSTPDLSLQKTPTIREKTPTNQKSRERKSSIDSSTSKLSKKGGKKKSLEPPGGDKKTYPSMDLKNGEARIVEAPTFYPTEKDFQDPLEYIDKIRPIAEKYGICRVVPPSNFKPECKVSDDMRFTAYNQYVHRMLHRWGPNVKELMAIKKYLATQSITLKQPPWIGGMEVDLPYLYQTVQSLGGLKEVIEKKKWQKVADVMKIPKSAQDRVTKLDDIYCKYLLPYDTLSNKEREKLFDEVDEEWKKREVKALKRLNASNTSDNEDDDSGDDDTDEIDECIVKGRNMPLNAFYRIARNTQRMWFGENQRGSTGNETDGASAIDAENGFWKNVIERNRHVCVHVASIDSSGRGFGFSVAKNSPFARHPWNLKVLTNNNGSILRSLGPMMGVTVPTLHVGMLFSACCWYRDPHGLPWIEYLHTGAKKIWYGIPNEHSDNFRDALSKMVPRFCKNKKIWLPSDTAMVPPETLVSNGVPLCRTVQEPGQFIVVFPKAFTSSICTGYVVSESVYFAQPKWLDNAEQIFKDLQDSCEPSMFSFERLLFSIINDTRSNLDVLKQILPAVTKIREREVNYRQELDYYGLTSKEKLELPGSGKKKKGQKVQEEESDYECETCRMDLFVSHVWNSQDDSTFCLPHALQLIARKKQVIIKNFTLKYSYSEEELDDLIHKLEDRIEAKSKKTNQIRQTK